MSGPWTHEDWNDLTRSVNQLAEDLRRVFVAADGDADKREFAVAN